MSLVLRLPRKMHLCRSSSIAPSLPSFLEMLQNPHVSLTFAKVHNPLRLLRETASERPKAARTCGALCILTSKCAFWLRHVLRATTACTLSTSQLLKVLRTWCALYILTWKCASRHNGVHSFDIATSKSAPKLRCFLHFDFEMCFAPQWRATFISHLASWLRTRRFSEPTFQPSGATNHRKNTVFRSFPIRLSLFWSSFFFSSLSLPTCTFPSVHTVGSLTSKLPSVSNCMVAYPYSCP